MNFETLAISESDGIAHIELNRPDKANAMNALMWKELKSAFEWLNSSKARVGVLSARGKNFTAGIDFELLMAVKTETAGLPDGARQDRLREIIGEMQAAISAAELCSKPVLAAIHGACVGGGVDLVTACDMRYATQDTKFSVKEVDLAIIADVGTLQRLPRMVGEGLARELAYTGREFKGVEAHAMRLVNQTFSDKESLIKAVMEIAGNIARKSPQTIRGIKDTLNYSRDHTVAEGLAYVAAKNAQMLFSADLAEAIAANMQKRAPIFED
jgi:enoyl-CoA hydratase